MSTANSVRAGAAFIEIFIKDQVTVGLKKINKSLLGFSAKAGLAGAAIGAGGLAILRPLISAGSEFAKFDTAMSAAGIAAELTKDQMSDLGGELKRIAVLRGTPLQDLADEVVELARAIDEVDPSQLADLADVISQLALANNATLGAARTGLLTTITGFGLDIAQARSVGDLLTKGAAAAAADLSDFVAELKYIGPVAKTAGVSLQTVIALSAALATIGIKGEEAGTQLKRLTVDVTANTAELEKAFNIKLPKGATFARVLEELSKATKNDDVTTRLSKYNKAFGLLGITAALGLGATAEQFKKFQEKFINSSGELQKQFDAIQGGLGGGFRRLSASFDVLRVTIGGALEDLFGKFASAIQAVNEAISPFIEKNKEIAEVLVLIGIGAVGAGAALVAMSASMIALSLASLVLNTNLGILVALLGVIFTPVGAIAIAIGILVAEVLLLGAAFLVFTKTGNAVAKSLGRGMIAAFKAVKDAVREILKTVKLTMEGISLAIKNGDLEGAANIAFQGLKVVALQALQDMVNAVRFQLKATLNLFGVSGQYAEAIFAVTVGNIIDLVSVVAKATVSALSFVDALIDKIFERVGVLSAAFTELAKYGVFGIPAAIAANSLGGKPKQGGAAPPKSALDKLLEENQKKLQELIDEQKKKLKIPDPKTGKALGAPDDKGVGSGISDAIEKGVKGMVSSSFDSTRGLIKGQQNAASASLKSIAGSTKEMADILRNGTINTKAISSAQEAEIIRHQIRQGVAQSQVSVKGKNTLTPEREARMRERIGELERQKQDRIDRLSVSSLRFGIEERRRAARERIEQEKKDRIERFNANRPFNQKATPAPTEVEAKTEFDKIIRAADDADKLKSVITANKIKAVEAETLFDKIVKAGHDADKIQAVVEAKDVSDAAKATAVADKIKEILKAEAIKTNPEEEARRVKAEEAKAESQKRMEDILKAIKDASVSQTKVLEKIADKEGAVFV